MKPGIKKILLISITILTLGMYTPPALIDANAAESEEIDSSTTKPNDNSVSSNNHTAIEFNENLGVAELDADRVEHDNTTLTALTEIAKNQTKAKLGPKIMNQVEDEFTTEILPNLEKVITHILDDANRDEVLYYGISEDEITGYGEKIFNLYDVRTNTDIARFHVRRENRPHDGYWFNFHYHLKDDDFENHHNIGEIYYDKNTPPRWMS
ncbi:YpjP-like protein [Salinibacillus kushneri]|uniref:YpjP-like protein n=1 Tax=Salinibacillus kushneri TaxID=237682 RepID=A0A1I0G0U0_9BACI|nr:YpjP family protein [Salinibacillus kushneri]SET64177.1 YpjP-like protein [Salinibacillus kushneri]